MGIRLRGSLGTGGGKELARRDRLMEEAQVFQVAYNEDGGKPREHCPDGDTTWTVSAGFG